MDTYAALKATKTISLFLLGFGAFVALMEIVAYYFGIVGPAVIVVLIVVIALWIAFYNLYRLRADTERQD